MTNQRRETLIYAASISDLVLPTTALYVSVFTRDSLASFSNLASRTVQIHMIAALIMTLMLWKITFSSMGFYGSKRLSPVVSELPILLKGSAAATAILALAGIIFRVHTINAAVLLRFLPLTAGALILSRLSARQALRALRRRGRNLRQIVVVGTNVRAVQFAETISSRPELGYRIAGFVDDAWIAPHGRYTPANLVSSLADFPSYLRNHVIDEVAIALPIKSFYEQEDHLLHTCREHGVIVRVLTNLFDRHEPHPQIDEIASPPVVTFSSVPLDSMRLAVKRTLDIFGSALMLILLSPIMLFAVLLIKLDSRGPAIFAQERIGLNKRRFRMYKFRSMVADAERLQPQLESRNEAQGPVFKIKSDPRITRIGRILRKTSIDELPQLFNVLKGDMSLVGPRPLPLRDYMRFSEDWQRRRFSVHPGITCLWQVSGRSAISFDQWMRLDMDYIDSWSVWLDMTILLRTIPAVVRGLGAT